MRLLKKYPNRRIYDTHTSQFITLADVRKLVLERHPIQVLHSKTGQDLTRAVLLQIITEQEDEGHASLLTNRVLEELIRFYGDQMAHMIGPFIEQQIVHYISEQNRMREEMAKAFTTPFAAPYPTPEQMMKTMTEHYQAFANMMPGAAAGMGAGTSATPEAGEAPEEDSK